MEIDINSNLEKVRQLCKNGYIDEALPILDRLIGLFPEYDNDLIYERAIMLFENGRIKDALNDFIYCYNRTRSQEVLSVILSFGQADEERFKERFYRNHDKLSGYSYIFGYKGNDITTKIIWKDETTVVFYDTEDDNIYSYSHYLNDTKDLTEKSVLLVNMLSGNVVTYYMDACKESWSVYGRTIPVYLFFRKNSFDAFLQCIELEELIKREKLVFFIGEESFEEFFRGEMVRYPAYIIGDDADNDNRILNRKLAEISSAQEEESTRLREENKEYYDTNGDEIMSRIRMKKPRIAFFTSIYTTALQYHTDFCSKNLRSLGIETIVVKEDCKIKQLRNTDSIKYVHEFKPDIIFKIDHFRFESDENMELRNLVCVSWIQDYLPNMEASNASRLTDKDVIMVQFGSRKVKEFLSGRRYIDALAPADESVYKPYELSDEEMAKYGCDICMVCHGSDVEAFTDSVIASVRQKGANDAEEVITNLFQAYYNMVYNGKTLHRQEEFRKFIDEELCGKEGLWQTDKMKEMLAFEMLDGLNQRVFRQVLADWLIEAGYCNIKLWGNGWEKSPKYKEYAMGPAQNGEVLSKINQASKIVLGNNIMLSGATRLWETTLSKGFYLSNYVPPEDDCADIRKVLIEGQDFVMFHNKQELLDNVAFYLSNEEERQKMIEIGRNAILEKMTYKGIMKKMLDEVPIILDNQVCPFNGEDQLFNRAVWEVEHGRTKDALMDFIRIYELTESEEVLSIILSYAQSDKERFRERFYRNREKLINYEYLFGEPEEEITTQILWKDETTLIFYDNRTDKLFKYDYLINFSGDYSEKSVLLVNVVSGKTILYYLEACKEHWSINDRVIPVYAFYNANTINALLQCVELEDLLQLKKLVIIIGQERFEAFFSDEMVRFPVYLSGDDNDNDMSKLFNKLTEIDRIKQEEFKRLHEENLRYYEENGNEILEHIRQKKPRVIIFTSRYTTALQYHAEFCAKNLHDLGCEALVVKEKSGIYHLRTSDIEGYINEFKPDVSLQLDHFRFEMESEKELNNLVNVSWIQDYLPIMQPSNASKLTIKDVIMVQFHSSKVKEFLQGRRYIDTLAPADETVYKPYELTDDEIARYGCDICMVCHASDVEAFTKKTIVSMANRGAADAEEVITRLFKSYYDSVYNGTVIYNQEGFKKYVDDFLRDYKGFWEQEEVRDKLAFGMLDGLNQRVYRQVLADWLIEAGYRNIKLWGSGWTKSPKYNKYAMGPAENGEVLSKINQASRVVLGNNVMLSGATRAWETMLSGGFYLSNYVPPEDDSADIRNVLTEGKEFVMFHNREELLENVDYYLTHEDERQIAIKRSRDAALSKMTYKHMMKKMLDEMPIILEEQGAWKEES